MNSRQLEKYWAALEELLSPAPLSTRNGMGGSAGRVNIPGAHLSGFVFLLAPPASRAVSTD